MEAPSTSHQNTIPPSPEASQDLFPMDQQGEEGDIFLSLAEAGAENNAEGDMEELPPEEGTSTSTQVLVCERPVTENPTDLAPRAILRELFPKSRLAYVKARTKRVSAVQKFGEEMIRHSIRQRKVLLEASHKEHEEFMNLMKASLEEERQTRELLGGILQGTLVALQDLTQIPLLPGL
ncbi:UNVERIFIED_CONTAM: hypothetical protein K2H54_044683 [Gekko kuhli]